MSGAKPMSDQIINAAARAVLDNAGPTREPDTMNDVGQDEAADADYLPRVTVLNNGKAMTDTHTIKGKPLSEASDEDLRAEYDAGNWLDCQEGLSVEQEKRLLAVEAEMAKRSDPLSGTNPLDVDLDFVTAGHPGVVRR